MAVPQGKPALEDINVIAVGLLDAATHVSLLDMDAVDLDADGVELVLGNEVYLADRADIDQTQGSGIRDRGVIVDGHLIVGGGHSEVFHRVVGAKPQTLCQEGEGGVIADTANGGALGQGDGGGAGDGSGDFNNLVLLLDGVGELGCCGDDVLLGQMT